MLIYGINPVKETLLADPTRVQRLLVSRGKAGPRLQEIIDLARERGIPIHFEPSESLARRAETPRHQEVVAEVSEIAYCSLEDILEKSPRLLLMVDGVEDPHNLGAVLRTGEAVGIDGLLLPDRRSCGITPAVLKASSGAAIHLKIARIGNVAQTLEKLKKAGLWTVGLDMSGQHSLEDLDISQPLAVVVGGEHQGLRRLVREKCDWVVALPMKGRVGSLNLSVAAGVLLYGILLRLEGKGG